MQRRFPLVTFALIVLNLAVHLAKPAGQCAQAAFVQRYGAIPWELTHNQQLPAAAVERVARCSAPDLDKNPAVSALTSMFVHASTAHLLGNLLLLALVGWSVERRMGSVKFAVFYLVCGYTAAYGFAFTVPSDTSPLVGASGAIAGALAAHIWLQPRDLVIPLLALPLLIPMPGPSWLVGVPGGNVAYLAHVVGLLVGLVLAAFWLGRPPTERSPVEVLLQRQV